MKYMYIGIAITMITILQIYCTTDCIVHFVQLSIHLSCTASNLNRKRCWKTKKLCWSRYLTFNAWDT